MALDVAVRVDAWTDFRGMSRRPTGRYGAQIRESKGRSPPSQVARHFRHRRGRRQSLRRRGRQAA
jgi:hypothetical protein